MSLEAGLFLRAAWGSRAYALHLLLPPALALQRCWADTDALFAGIVDWQAQVRWPGRIGCRQPWPAR